MPLTLLEPRRIYREIAEQIAAMIASGELAPNSRLPSERDLAQRLGVSRPPVREALIALEVEGLVDVRIGSGVYVRQEAASRATTRRTRKVAEIGPFELLAARRMVESMIAAEAAKNATREQIKAIAETVEAIRNEDEQHYDLRHPADRLFHVRVAEASGNRALVLMTNVLWDLRDGSLHRRIEEHFSTHALRDRSNQDHEDILGAIRKHDSSAAANLMRKHLTRVERELSRAWPTIAESAAVAKSAATGKRRARIKI
ncbi:MAG TPA: FadR/GntR family transcriptional regulator [Burkholderiales bacterium]|nr:FadR/GntR family transcriptional regulator [Burkholderiales bacterium]